MRSFIYALCGALALAGCTTIQTSDDAIRKALPTACASVEALNVSFLAISDAHPLSEKVLRAEATAYAGAKAICDHPENATTMAVVIQVTTAATVIALQLREAEKAGS